MKIFFDHQTFSLQKHGGISRYFYELIPRVCKMSTGEVSLFMGFHINEYGLEKTRNLYTHFFGHRVPLVPHTLTMRLELNASLLKLFSARVDNAIYHQTYFYDLLPKWKGKRVVTVYDMIYELYRHDYDDDDPTAKNKAIAVGKADEVICISESTKRDVVNMLGISPAKVTVIHLASSMSHVVNSPRIVQSAYVLFVGKRAGYKNFSRLLKAFVQCPALRRNFKIICFGGGDFTTEERENLRSLSINDCVEYIAGSDEVLANLYTYAAVLVYPSEYEGFGIPPLEAMHYGCPVAASSASSIPEVVGEAGVYFDPLAENDIAAKLESVVFDSNLRTKLIASGKQREKLFSWEKCAEQTLNVYQKLQ